MSGRELSAPARLAGFAVLLLLVFLAAFGVGRVTGDAEPAPAHPTHGGG